MTEDRQDGGTGPADWRASGEEQLPTDAYHVWKPRPLLRSVHWKPVPSPSREAGAGSYDVFIDQRVFKAVHQQLWNAGPAEQPFGFLVGDLCEDPDTGRRYILVSAAVPSRFPLTEAGPEQIPGESLVAMKLEVDRRRGVLAGWYHRHGSGPIELTPEDVRTHETRFVEPWQIALLFVTDHAHPTGGCFRRSYTGLSANTPLPFFEMVSNESLLARGVRRSYLDWLDVETVDAIEAEPPPRPAPAPEPEPEPEPEPLTEIADEASEQDLVWTADDEAGESEFLDEDMRLDIDLVPDEDLGTGETADEELDLDIELVPDEDLQADQDLATGEETAASETGANVDLASDVLAELEAAESELVLRVAEETGEPDSGSSKAVDGLPEPGWDAGDADDVSLPLAEDVNLDSFVTEVEAADVAAQVDAGTEEGVAEPQWDDAESEAGPEVDLGAALDELEEPPEYGEEGATGAAEAARPARGQSVAETTVGVIPQAPSARKARTVPLAVVGVLIVIAVLASAVVFLRSPEADDDAEGALDAIPPASAEALPQGGGAPVAGEPSGTGDSPEAATVGDTTAPATAAELEQLGDGLLESISRYYGRAVAADGGQATCTDLQAAYVEVEDRWIAYNVQGRARFRGRLPDELAARDERLYAGVQDVEREFTRSGCERP